MLAIFCVNLLLAPIILVWISLTVLHACRRPGPRVGLACSFSCVPVYPVGYRGSRYLTWSFTRLAQIGRMVLRGFRSDCLSRHADSLLPGRVTRRANRLGLDKLARQIDAGEVQSLVIAGNRLRPTPLTANWLHLRKMEAVHWRRLRNLGISDQDLRAITIEVGQVGFGERQFAPR